jgi:hypothetical protein
VLLCGAGGARVLCGTGGAQALALHGAVSELVLKRDQKSSEKKGFAPEIEKKRNCKKWIFQKKNGFWFFFRKKK